MTVKPRTSVLSALFFCFLLLGCNDDAQEPDRLVTIEGAEYDPALNVELDEMTESETGLYYRDFVEGDGEEAEPGDIVAIRYTGWLADGTEFDSNVEADEPFTFELDADQVISGFNEGVTGMQEGGERQLQLARFQIANLVDLMLFLRR